MQAISNAPQRGYHLGQKKRKKEKGEKQRSKREKEK